MEIRESPADRPSAPAAPSAVGVDDREHRALRIRHRGHAPVGRVVGGPEDVPAELGDLGGGGVDIRDLEVRQPVRAAVARKRFDSKP